MLKKEDTFIFFFANKGRESSLQNLIQATETWVQKHQENQKAENPTRMMPLRQHLLQVLFNALLTRIEQLGNAQEGSDLLLAAQSKLVLLKDNTCPYVQWDHTKKALVVSNRSPLAYNLQKTLLPTRGASKGKGKGKNKMHQPTKEDP